MRFFNPGSNNDQQSLLRLINPSGTEVIATIAGLDDDGDPPPEGDVRVALPAHAARTITAQQLEDGGDGVEGSFGDGKGKWQLFVSAEASDHGQPRPLQVLSLLFSRPTENLTNLSAIGLGNDPNRGSDGTDYIVGGSGDDFLNPGDNNNAFDVVIGSAGDDTVVYTHSGPTASQLLDYADLSEGIEATIDGSSNTATVSKGAAGTDTIEDVVNPLNAAMEEPYGVFLMYGSHSDDTFELTLDDGQYMVVAGNAGDDRIEILSGVVHVSYETSTEGVDVDLAEGRANDDGFGGVDTIVGDVFRLEGGSGNDTLRGTDGKDVLDGRAGDDELDPRDVDYRTGGADDIYASTGNDRIVYSNSGTHEYASQQLFYSTPWSALQMGLEEGIEVTIDGATNSATVDKGSAGTDTIEDVNHPLGGGSLLLHGTWNDDRFDLSLDHGQFMTVQGVGGHDTFNLRTVAWESRERPGSYMRVSYRYSRGGIELDLLDEEASNDGFGSVDTFEFIGDGVEFEGTDFTDVIRGSNGNDEFAGRGGNDIIDGRAGFDRLRFDRPGGRAVQVDLREGTSTGTWISTNDFAGVDPTSVFSFEISNIEYVRGSNYDDDLLGSSDDERFEGRQGNDTLNGRGGNDRLRGEGGDDVFIFERGHGDDRIDDFTDGEDTIVFRGLRISKQDVLNNALPRGDEAGVRIDLTSFGGGTIDVRGIHRDDFDESDFLL